MEHEILAAVADGVTTAIPGKPAGRGSKRRRDTLEFGVKLLFLLCGCVAVGVQGSAMRVLRVFPAVQMPQE